MLSSDWGTHVQEDHMEEAWYTQQHPQLNDYERITDTQKILNIIFNKDVHHLGPTHGDETQQ